MFKRISYVLDRRVREMGTSRDSSSKELLQRALQTPVDLMRAALALSHWPRTFSFTPLVEAPKWFDGEHYESKYLVKCFKEAERVTASIYPRYDNSLTIDLAFYRRREKIAWADIRAVQTLERGWISSFSQRAF